MAQFAARICFGATLVFLPFRLQTVILARPELKYQSGYTDYLLFVADLTLLLTLAFWATSMLALPRRLKLGPRAFWIPLLGLTATGWASSLHSYDRPLSVYHAIRLLGLFWFYLYIVNEITSLGWVLIPVGLQVLIQSVAALGQYFLQRSLLLQWMGEMSLDPAQRGISIVAADGARLLRAYGLTDHPNILGGCLAFGLLLMLYAYVQGMHRWLAFAVLILGLPALLVTFSRSAWLAFLLGSAGIVALKLWRNRQEAVRPLLVLAVASLVAVMPVILVHPRFFGVRLGQGGSFTAPTVEQQAIGERLLLIQSSSAMIRDHLVFGVGLGAAPVALKAYQPQWTLGFEPPHVALLDVAVETGLPGAVFYLALMLAPFVLYLNRRPASFREPLVSVTVALLLAITIAGFFDYYTWLLVPGRLWLWLAWGLAAAALMPRSQLAASYTRSPARPGKLIADVHPSA